MDAISRRTTAERRLKVAVTEFMDPLTNDQLETFFENSVVPDADSILVFTAELDSVNKGRTGQSVGSRVFKLLQSVRDFCSIIDTIVVSNPEVAALAWGSVKSTMQIAVNHRDYCEAISMLSMDLGNYCPSFADYKTLHQSSKELQESLLDFHVAIIDCCKHIIEVTQRPWHKQLRRPFEDSFTQEFAPDAKNVRRRGESVQNTIRLAKAKANVQERRILQGQRPSLPSVKNSYHHIIHYIPSQKEEPNDLDNTAVVVTDSDGHQNNADTLLQGRFDANVPRIAIPSTTRHDPTIMAEAQVSETTSPGKVVENLFEPDNPAEREKVGNHTKTLEDYFKARQRFRSDDLEVQEDSASVSSRISRVDSEESLKSIRSESERCTTPLIPEQSWWIWLRNMYSKPPAGYERVWYYCGCGELSFLDVKQLTQGGIQRFRSRLEASCRAVTKRPQNSQTSNLLAVPTPIYVRNSRSVRPTRSRPPSTLTLNEQVRDTERQARIARSESLESENEVALQFLLLCINTKSSTALAQMEVGCLSNDQYLFRRISHEYEKIRRDHEWRLSLVMPQSVSDFFDRYVSKNWPSLSSYGSNLLTKLCNALAKARVHTIASGDFVRFQLVPIGDQCCPRWFKAREVPPEEEVRAKRYHYEPVPMDDVEFADIPLKHLMKPGPHTDKFWITTFPKKLDLQLVRPAGQNGQRVIGWGIHIKEKLNWPYILLVMFAMLLVSSGAVAIYAIVTSDHSSAFGLGAFLVALMTVYITYQYFAWKEQDS